MALVPHRGALSSHQSSPSSMAGSSALPWHLSPPKKWAQWLFGHGESPSSSDRGSQNSTLFSPPLFWWLDFGSSLWASLAPLWSGKQHCLLRGQCLGFCFIVWAYWETSSVEVIDALHWDWILLLHCIPDWGCAQLHPPTLMAIWLSISLMSLLLLNCCYQWGGKICMPRCMSLAYPLPPLTVFSLPAMNWHCQTLRQPWYTSSTRLLMS